MTVNTLDMLLVHRVFRREFHDVTELIDGVSDGDAARARVVGDHLAFMLSALHHHHAAEDELVWPKLRDRVAGSEADIARMEDEHSAIAGAVHRTEVLLGPWVESGSRGGGRQLAAAAAELTVLLDEHLEDEERIALPIIEKHLRDDEWQATLKRGASFLSARNARLGVVLLGMVLSAASKDERRVFISNLPVPQRLMAKLFGTRAAASYKKRLFGVRSPRP